MSSTSTLMASRSFVVSKVTLTVGWAGLGSSFARNISSNDHNFNFVVKFLESKASLIKLRLLINASLTVPLFGPFMMDIDL